MFLPHGGRRDRLSPKNPFPEVALPVLGMRHSSWATDTLRIASHLPSHRECRETRRESPRDNPHTPQHLLPPSEPPPATAAGDTPLPPAQSAIQIRHTTL